MMNRTFESRLKLWFRMKIRQYSLTADGAYFVQHGGNVTRSVLSIMAVSCMQNLDISDVLGRYKRLRRGQYQTPDPVLQWMQIQCNILRSKFVYPFKLQSNPHLYM